MNPYFLPLKNEYYEKICNLEQDCEIRPANHRGWRQKNIYPGRFILLSSGYGKKKRIIMSVFGTFEGPSEYAFIGIPQWHIDAVEQIYGKRNRWLVAYLRRC